MKTTLIAKTILNIMPRIDEVRESIFRKNNTLAINSMNSFHDTYCTVERILENIDRSSELNNLKTIIMEQVETMPEKLRRIIQLRFFEKQHVEQIAAHMKISARTVFRLLELAIEHFTNNLKKIGIDYFRFRKLVERNAWIDNEYRRQELSSK